jgi:hypothetical protein
VALPFLAEASPFKGTLRTGLSIPARRRQAHPRRDSTPPLPPLKRAQSPRRKQSAHYAQPHPSKRPRSSTAAAAPPLVSTSSLSVQASTALQQPTPSCTWGTAPRYLNLHTSSAKWGAIQVFPNALRLLFCWGLGTILHTHAPLSLPRSPFAGPTQGSTSGTHTEACAWPVTTMRVTGTC